VPPHFDFATPILIVDDHPMMVDIMTRMIRRIGFEDVEHAADGDEALQRLRKRRHELVISDLNMGAFGGLQLLRAVRSDETLRHTRFLIVTADCRTANVTVANKARRRCLSPETVHARTDPGQAHRGSHQVSRPGRRRPAASRQRCGSVRRRRSGAIIFNIA
jgi:two-component system chemotaxis response regulator CheY